MSGRAGVDEKYCGVILAAGTGSRLGPLGLTEPKPLLPICNKPIVQYQIESMAALGVKRVFVVCGHLEEKLRGYFGDGTGFGVEIRYLKQERPHGIAHALAQAEQCVDLPFFVFLGDIFYLAPGLQRMADLFEHRGASSVLAVRREPRPELIKKNYAVFLHESGMVRRVVEKPRYVVNDLKGCGIYLFDLPIFDAVRRTPRTAMRDEYEITSSIQILIDDGYPVYPAEVIDWDMNVTFVGDLITSNLKVLELSGKDAEIGRNVRLHPGAVIHNSVIGHDAVVEHPIEIRDSVVLSGAVLRGRENLTGVLAVGESVLQAGAQTGGLS